MLVYNPYRSKRNQGQVTVMPAVIKMAYGECLNDQTLARVVVRLARNDGSVQLLELHPTEVKQLYESTFGKIPAAVPVPAQFAEQLAAAGVQVSPDRETQPA